MQELLSLDAIEVTDESEYETAMDKWRAYASMLQHFPAEQLPAAPPQPRAHEMRLLRAK